MAKQDDVTERVYRLARALLPEMDETLRAEVESLLARAASGEKTDNCIVELLRQDERLRPRLREALVGDSERGLSYPMPGGDPTPPPARKYVCPQCDYIFYLHKAGQQPGECPQHHVPLIPFEQKGAA